MRVIEVTTAPSRRLLEACGTFGLLVRHDQRCGAWRARRRQLAMHAVEIDHDLSTGGVAIITGPSGCGKSTLLDTFVDVLHRRNEPCVRVEEVSCAHRTSPEGNLRAPAPSARPLPPRSQQDPPCPSLIDMIEGDLACALRLLTRAGLADPTLLARSACELSEGQRARLAIALAIQHAERDGTMTIVVDELAACLDRATARCTCAMIARWCREQGRRLVAATPRDDIADVMSPDLLVHPGGLDDV